MCVVLRDMEYQIKLSNGMTKSYSSKNKDLFGTGQGAGWSPTCWAVNSDVISHSVEKYTPGMVLTHPNGEKLSDVKMVAFVDDTSMGISTDGIKTFQPKTDWPVQRKPNMHQQLQANVSFYARTLESTGGALAYEKCKVYLLMFVWINGIKTMLANKAKFPPLQIQSLLTGIFHFIALANPDEAFRMLGAFVAPNGDTTTQVKVLKSIAVKWANKIEKSYLTPHESLVAYVQVLFPALVYPVAVMPLKEKDCDDIVRPAIKALLKKINLPANTNRSLLYGPARYGGMEIPNLYVHGNVLKIMMFIGHLQKKDTTMPILRVALGAVQQQIGVSTPIMEANYSKYHVLVEPCWMTHIWKFLYEIKGKIVLDNHWIPKSPYQNDCMIMDKVMEIQLPQVTVKKINQCRLQKQIYFISDILDSRQKSLHPSIMDPTYKRLNKEKFPVVEIPKSYWKIWSNVLRSIHASLRVSSFNLGKTVHKDYATWLQKDDRSYLILRMDKNSYRFFKLKERSRTKFIYDRDYSHDTTIYGFTGLRVVQVQVTPSTFITDGFEEISPSLQTDINQQHTISRRLVSLKQWLHQNLFNLETQKQSKWNVPVSEQINTQLPNEDIEAFLKAVEELPPVLRRNLGGIQEMNGIAMLAQAMELDSALGVSDASIGTRGRAAHGYVIESSCGKYNIIGVAPVDCDIDDLESTRAELWGQVAIQTVVNILCELYSVHTGTVAVYGDNIDSLVKSRIHTSKIAFPRFFRPNMDVKLLLQRLRDECHPKLEIHPEHIKGHQDRQKAFSYETAPKPVQLNIDMDDLSRTFLKTSRDDLEPGQTQLLIPGQEATLVLGTTTVSNNIHHHVNIHFFGHELEKRFRDKTGISKTYQEQIPWRAFERAFRKANEKDKISIFSLIHDKWPTNMRQAQWDAEKDPLCQLCIDREETFDHVFACTSKQTSTTFKKGMTKFRDTLRKANTAPIIIAAFDFLFSYFRKGREIFFKHQQLQSNEMNDLVQEAIKYQKDMGVNFFIKGYLSSTWEIVQNIYLGNTDFNDRLTDWSTKIIRAIWKFSCSFWRNRCDVVHGKDITKSSSARRAEIIKLINKELERTKMHAEHSTRQLRQNVRKSIGNARVAALEIWLDMLRNVKGEIYLRKSFEGISTSRAQPITNFFRRLE